MKTYKIQCYWEVCGVFTCEAESLEDAITQAEEGALPSGEYVGGSFKINEDMVREEYPDEANDALHSVYGGG